RPARAGPARRVRRDPQAAPARSRRRHRGDRRSVPGARKGRIMNEETDSELRDQIADALLVLANVGYGDLHGRVESRGGGASPLTGLAEGSNEMIEALRIERGRSRAYQAESEEKLAMMAQRRAAIRERSTPVIEVWDGILCLPVVGIVDSARSAQMTDIVL